MARFCKRPGKVQAFFSISKFLIDERVTTRADIWAWPFCKKFSIRCKVIDLLAFQKVRIKLLLWDVNHRPTYYVLTFSVQIEFSFLMMEDAALEQPFWWVTEGTTPFVIKKTNLCNLFVLFPTFYTVVAFVAACRGHDILFRRNVICRKSVDLEAAMTIYCIRAKEGLYNLQSNS